MKNVQLINPQKDQIKPPTGYTLIEILVVVGIMALIFSFGYVTYRDFSRRQSLISAARSFKGQLKLAQEYAMSGKKPQDCTGNLVGYKVTVNEVDYSIQAVCGNGLQSVDKESILFPEGITASVSVSPPSFTFKVLGQGTDIGATPIGITLKQDVTLSTTIVSVSNTGEIQ